MKPPSSEVSPCDDPRSLLENCASPRCGSHDRARLSTLTSVFAAGWPPSVTVFRRSRRARLLGACARVRLSTFAFTSTFGSCRRPSLRTALGALLRVHDLSPLAELRAALTFSWFVSAFVFRRSRPFPLRRLTVHGLASSCHVATAFTAILFREPPLHTAHVHRVCAHLATITFACPYHRAFA
jgi:hypothetical protein